MPFWSSLFIKRTNKQLSTLGSLGLFLYMSSHEIRLILTFVCLIHISISFLEEIGSVWSDDWFRHLFLGERYLRDYRDRCFSSRMLLRINKSNEVCFHGKQEIFLVQQSSQLSIPLEISALLHKLNIRTEPYLSLAACLTILILLLVFLEWLVSLIPSFMIQRMNSVSVCYKASFPTFSFPFNIFLVFLVQKQTDLK